MKFDNAANFDRKAGGSPTIAFAILRRHFERKCSYVLRLKAVEEHQTYPTFAGANVGHPAPAYVGGICGFPLSGPPLAEKCAQQLSTLVRQNSARNQHLVIEPGMIQDLQN
jgi:hypothetical protein